jgi:hypothetical protein
LILVVLSGPPSPLLDAIHSDPLLSVTEISSTQFDYPIDYPREFHVEYLFDLSGELLVFKPLSKLGRSGHPSPVPAMTWNATSKFCCW